MCVMAYLLSLPLRERGFKRHDLAVIALHLRRSPCGNMDLNLTDLHTNRWQVSGQEDIT